MGYKIKEERKRLEITQEQLAEKAKVSRAIISGLESGRITTTTTNTLTKIAAALGKTVSEIFFDQ